MERSNLISDDENNKFLKLIEPKCKTLSFTVAKLYYAKSDSWELVDSGIVSLTKDNERRSYFIQLFNMDNSRKSDEFEILYNSAYEKIKPQIHTVVTTNCKAMLEFADLSESERFCNEVMKIINLRKEQKEKRMSLVSSTNDESMSYRNTAPVIKGPRKITKNDISNPSNFQHLDHMGLNEHFFTSPNDENLMKQCFKGTPFECLLDDKNEMKNIYDFVEQHGGMSKLEAEMKQRENKSRKAPELRKSMPAAPQKQPPPPPPPSRPPPNVRLSNAMAKPQAPISGAPLPTPPVSAPAFPTVPKPSQNIPVPVSEEPSGSLNEIVKLDSEKLKEFETALKQRENENQKAPVIPK